MLITQIFDDVPVGTMGKPLPGGIAEIMDDNGNVLKEPEEIGELVFLVTKKEKKTREVEYFKDENASKNLIQKGADGQNWFHTGDLAFKDKYYNCPIRHFPFVECSSRRSNRTMHAGGMDIIFSS